MAIIVDKKEMIEKAKELQGKITQEYDLYPTTLEAFEGKSIAIVINLIYLERDTLENYDEALQGLNPEFRWVLESIPKEGFQRLPPDNVFDSR